jgi:hypothetical protein
MPGFMPGIHVLASSARKAWMAGTSPAMMVSAMAASLSGTTRADSGFLSQHADQTPNLFVQ